MILTLLILLLFFLFSSAPIFVAMTIACFLTVLFVTDIRPMMLIQRLFSGIDQFSLMALPFFIFAANVMEVGGLSKRILRWARALVGHLAGGVAMTTQMASMFFGALSGSSPATVVAIGKLMYPEMMRAKYDKWFAAGLMASAGSISLVIPPSITFIIYGSVTGVSVGDLFIAGIGAGIVLGLSGIAYIYFYAKKHNLPRDKRASWRELWDATAKSLWALLIPVIIVGGSFIRIGYDADITIVDMNREGTISRNALHSKSKVTAFDGFPIKGIPVQTIVRGKTVMKDGQIVGEPSGRLVTPAGMP